MRLRFGRRDSSYDRVSAENPKCHFFFLLQDQEVTEGISEAFEAWLVGLGSCHRWVLEGPQLVDYIDENPDRPGGSREAHTYGGAVQMYSAWPPWGEKLPKDVDRAHLHEASHVVSALCVLSAKTKWRLSLQLDHTHIGFIENGEADHGVRVVFLKEWEKLHGA